MKIDGRREAFGEFLVLLDTYPFWFNVVTPNRQPALVGSPGTTGAGGRQ